MSQLFTLGDVLDRLNQRLNLEDEAFITRDEKVNYINEGVQAIEKEIHKLNLEDNYFLASQPLNLSSGQAAYGLPVNIYANKILKIMYHNGSIIYEINRMRNISNQSVMSQIAYINQFGLNDDYQYIVKNDSAQFGNEIVLYPPSREDSTTNATIWYIRQANTLSVDSDLLDIPEGLEFIIQYAKCQCLRKEFMGNVPEGEIAERTKLKNDLIAVLEEMVPDENNKINEDMTFYTDFDFYGFNDGGMQ